MSLISEKWTQITDNLRIKNDMSNVSFSTWIEPLVIYDVINNTVFLKINEKDYIEYLENKYTIPIQNSIKEITDSDYSVVFFYDEKEVQQLINKVNSRKTKSIFEKAELNEKYTFDTFVVGGNNRFAHAASEAVADNPGKTHNPLYLYGGVGLGKTHLMHSIAHKILENNPKSKVVYVTSEKFTNDLISALRNKNNEEAMTNFREKYRNCDILLVDDIQFIAGKDSTQEEFFHTFNILYNNSKQIVISSDRPPKEMERLEERLQSRFEMGIIADISAPDYETRMAILQRKIERDGFEKYFISNDVLEHIAKHIKTNIRELEGSLNKLIALYKLDNGSTPIDINLANKVLADFITDKNNAEITPEYILDVVSEHFSISIKDLKSTNRSANIANARQICMYLMRKLTNTSLKSIGVYLGNKDHSTVKHGINKIEKEMKTDETMSNTIDILNKKINPIL